MDSRPRESVGPESRAEDASLATLFPHPRMTDICQRGAAGIKQDACIIYLLYLHADPFKASVYLDNSLPVGTTQRHPRQCCRDSCMPAYRLYGYLI